VRGRRGGAAGGGGVHAGQSGDRTFEEKEEGDEQRKRRVHTLPYSFSLSLPLSVCLSLSILELRFPALPLAFSGCIACRDGTGLPRGSFFGLAGANSDELLAEEGEARGAGGRIVDRESCDVAGVLALEEEVERRMGRGGVCCRGERAE
jgi:hypothetical protein